MTPDPKPASSCRPKSNYAAVVEDRQASGELLILPDGRILAHNITPALARLLSAIDPDDEAMRQRAALTDSPPDSFPSQ
jgi:hypothetical protein